MKLTIEITAKVDGRETYSATLTPANLAVMERLVKRLAAAVEEPEVTYLSSADALRALFPPDGDATTSHALLRRLADAPPITRLELVLAEFVRREKVEAAVLAVGGLVPIDDQGRHDVSASEAIARDIAEALVDPDLPEQVASPDARSTAHLDADLGPEDNPFVDPAPTLGAVVHEQRIAFGLTLREGGPMSAYREGEAPPPLNIGPVKCADCVHWTNGPPMDCAKVPTDLRYRSIVLVNKHWGAEAKGCPDYAPRPSRNRGVEKLRQAGSEMERLTHNFKRAKKASKSGTGRLLLFIAQDHNLMVAARVAWKLAVNAACRRLGVHEHYRRPLKGAGLNMSSLKRALARAMPKGRRDA